MNRGRVLKSTFAACGVVVVCTAVYLKHPTEGSTTAAATDGALIAAQIETAIPPATVEDSPEENPTGEKIAKLSTELERLEKKVDVLNQEVQRRLAASSAATKEGHSGNAEPADPGADPSTPAELERQAQERARTLEENFQAERTEDVQWSSQASTALQSALASAQVGDAQVNNLECRSRQCRVQMVFQDGASTNALMDELSRQLAEILPTIAMHTERHGDATAVVLYLFGEGYKPPQSG